MSVQYFLEIGDRLNIVKNIEMRDINLMQDMVVLTTTKNTKQMYIPLSSRLIKVLTGYIRAYKNFEDAESCLFPTKEVTQMTKDSN